MCMAKLTIIINNFGLAGAFFAAVANGIRHPYSASITNTANIYKNYGLFTKIKHVQLKVIDNEK